MSAARLGGLGAAAFLVLVLADVALMTRPPLPVSEARYLSVPWEMWLAGDWLVPRMNGQPYPDKPPVVFWATLLGWSVTGVSETWARLVSPLFGIGALALAGALARLLWPEVPGARVLAPLLLVGMPVFMLFSTVAFFDVPLAFFVLLGLVGVALAWRGRWAGGFALAGLAMGFGVLTKGPVALLHTLPVMLLAPLWARLGARSWPRWYLGVAAAFMLTAMVALGWALPAAARGGAGYAAALLWGQTGGRLATSFAHAEPWWWYLPWLPLLAYPWVWWPPLWRAAREAGHVLGRDPGIRFCVLWFTVPLLGFTAISGKQPHYLVPLLPALALLAARLAVEAPPPRRWDAWPALLPLVLVALVGLALTVLDAAALPERAAAPLAEVSALGPLVLALGLAGLVAARWRTREQCALQLIGAVALGYLAVHAAFAADLRPRFDLAPVARVLAEAEIAGHPIAHPTGYEGHFQFIGRLTRPLDEVDEPALQAWAAAHPDGLVVSYPRRVDGLPATPTVLQPFRGRWIAVWPADAVAAEGYAALSPQR